MSAQIILFHTMDSNIALYEHAGRNLAAEIELQHVVSDDLIQRATDAGSLTADIRHDAKGQMQNAVTASAVILCTCSTIGPAADDLSHDGTPVLRTDRALAEEVFSKAGRVAVLVAAPSTVTPTTDLFAAAAAAAAPDVSFDVILVDGAWDCFNDGDAEGYVQAIAARADQCHGQFDRVALAQASMAPAKERMIQKSIPAYTSPEAGMRAALAATAPTTS